MACKTRNETLIDCESPAMKKVVLSEYRSKSSTPRRQYYKRTKSGMSVVNPYESETREPYRPASRFPIASIAKTKEEEEEGALATSAFQAAVDGFRNSGLSGIGPVASRVVLSINNSAVGARAFACSLRGGMHMR